MDPIRQKCKICQSGHAPEIENLLRQGRTYNEIIFLMKDKIPGLKSSHITSHKKHPSVIESEIAGLQQGIAAVKQSVTEFSQKPEYIRRKPMDDMELLDMIKEKASMLFDRTTDPTAMQKLAMIIIEIIRLKYEITGTIYAPPAKLLTLEEGIRH